MLQYKRGECFYMGYVLYVQLYMPLELPSFIDHGRWAVARDFLMKTTYWPHACQ